MLTEFSAKGSSPIPTRSKEDFSPFFELIKTRFPRASPTQEGENTKLYITVVFFLTWTSRGPLKQTPVMVADIAQSLSLLLTNGMSWVILVRACYHTSSNSN